MHANHALLTGFLDAAAARGGDASALEDRERRLTFAETRAAGIALAEDLARRGVEPGDRVIVTMANSVAFCVAFWGVLYAGAVAVPLNPGTKRDKLAWILGDCTPAAVICDADLEELVRGACAQAGHEPALIVHGAADRLGETIAGARDAGGVPPSAGRVIDQDLAAIIYTSGSTGDPKGVMLTHLNMTSAARSVAQYLGYRPDDRVFCAIPMTFDYGLHQLTMTTLVGACLLVEPSFAQPLFALQRLAGGRATVFPIVPTMVPLIAPLADRFDLSHVRLVSSTAAALHGAAIDRVAAIFPGARLFSMYGLTECHRCTYLDPSELATRKTSVGKAIPNTEMWVVDAEGRARRSGAVGELVIRGATVMRGYWRNPEKTAEKLRPGPIAGETVLYTGDTCRIDEDGFLYFVARSDDILKVAGEKVAPGEIEATLSAHPAVAEACALGVDHPVYGQRCVAIVALAPGAAGIDGAALKDWCAERLEPHATPSRILVVDAMPRNGNGKIDRHRLRDLLPVEDAPAPRPLPAAPADMRRAG